MIFKSIIKGLYLACIFVTIVAWAAGIFASIYRGFCITEVFNSMLMGTLCLLLWMMVRRNECLIEEKNHWKKEYNDLVERVFKGYHQAEKDNKLTWKDMMVIHKCCKDAMNTHLYEWKTPEDQQKIYEDVLKRFKESKK